MADDINRKFDRILDINNNLLLNYLECMAIDMDPSKRIKLDLFPFDEISGLSLEERELYSEIEERFDPNKSSEFSDISLSKSIIIPEYLKADSKLFDENLSIIRSFNFFQEKKFDESDEVCYAYELDDFTPFSGDNFNIAYYFLQDSEFPRYHIMYEFKRIFLKTFHKNVEFNYTNNESIGFIKKLMEFKYLYLFSDPALEELYLGTGFTFDEPLELENDWIFEEVKSSFACCSYINEEFAKERGVDAITSLFNIKGLKDGYGSTFNSTLDTLINLSYLNSALILARDENTVDYLKDYYLENCVLFDKPEHREAHNLICYTFDNIDAERQSFTYTKKEN